MRLTTCFALSVFAFAACSDDTAGPADMTSDATQPPGDEGFDIQQFDMGDAAVIDMADQGVDAALDFAMPDLTGADFAGDFAVPPDLSGDFQPVLPVDAGPAPTVISHFRWVNFCESWTGCGFFGPGVTMSQCISFERKLGQLPLAPASTLTCVANAGNDCNAIKVCMNNGDPGTVSCDSSQGANYQCTGDVYNYCFVGQNFRFAEDCTNLGLSCISGGSNSACAFSTCPNNIGQNYCAAGFTVNCAAGGQGVLKPVEDCRVFDNETCTATGDADAGTTQAACTGTGAACTTDHCNGNILVACKNGHEATYDCTKRGEICTTLKGQTVPTCALGGECDPTTYQDTCNGSVLTFCDAGKISTLDCASAGWAGCTAGACSK